MKQLMTFGACVVLSFEAFALVNPAFSEGLAGWSKNLPGWSVEGGAGCNGSDGLVFRTETPMVPKWMMQRVKLEPGLRYRFGCWAKASPTKENRRLPKFALEWADANGRYVGGSYMGLSKADQWQQVEKVTDPIPTNAVVVHFIVFFDTVREGPVAGEFAFDDFFLEEAVVRALGNVASSAYRDLVDGTGEVKLFARTSIPSRVAPEDFAVAFAWNGPDGARQRRAVKGFSGDSASVTVEETAFALGTNDVTVTAHVRGKGVIDTRHITITRVERLPARRTYIDRFGRCVKDGKLFFPHGMYFNHATEKELDIFTNSPFNVIMPYHTPTAEQMDSIARHGLLTFVSLDPDKCGARESVEDYAKHLEKRYGHIKRHPAFFAWYLFDEAPLAILDRCVKTYQTVRMWDPDSIGWVVMCHRNTLSDFLPTMDVIGIDPYPVGNAQPLSEVASFCRAVRDAIGGTRPMWNVPQAFSWSSYRKRQVPPAPMPTKVELRNMTWQHIACGANGLISFHFPQLWCAGDPEANWRMVREVAYEVDKCIPIILSEPGPCVAAPKELAVRTWTREGGGLWVLVVNTEEKAISTTLAIPGVKDGLKVDLGRYEVLIREL